MAELELTDASFGQEVLNAAEPVLVDFWAPWCAPCRMIAPILHEIAKDYGGKVRVAKLNTDDNEQTAVRYKVSAIPTLLFFKGGKVAETLVGVHPKADIAKLLDKILEG